MTLKTTTEELDNKVVLENVIRSRSTKTDIFAKDFRLKQGGKKKEKIKKETELIKLITR